MGNDTKPERKDSMIKKIALALAVSTAALMMPPLALAAPTVAEPTVETAAAKNDAIFPAEPPVKKPNRTIKKALAEAAWQTSEAYDEPLLIEKEKASTVTIMGKAEASQRQMIRFIKKHNPKPKLNCSVEEIVRLYYLEGQQEGVRPDVALCQAIKETGFFNYGGDVIPKQNNFCGLGTIGGGVKGAFFATPQLGVRAHIQHLVAYATTQKPTQTIVDPRYEHIKKNRPEFFGTVKTWTGLNGKWAVPGHHYGQDILNLWRLAKSPDDSQETLIYASMDIRRNPKNAAAYIYRGIAYYNGGKYDAALADYDEAIKLAPGLESYYDRALCYEQMGQTNKAIADYTKSMEYDPEFMQNWYNRGLLYLKQGKYKAAIEDFDHVLNDAPQMANAAVGKGIAHIYLKKYKEAWQDFYRGGQINTENEIVKYNQKLIWDCYQKKK